MVKTINSMPRIIVIGGGEILKKGQEMKAEQLKVHLKHGGRKIFCMAKIML